MWCAWIHSSSWTWRNSRKKTTARYRWRCLEEFPISKDAFKLCYNERWNSFGWPLRNGNSSPMPREMSFLWNTGGQYLYGPTAAPVELMRSVVLVSELLFSLDQLAIGFISFPIPSHQTPTFVSIIAFGNSLMPMMSYFQNFRLQSRVFLQTRDSIEWNTGHEDHMEFYKTSQATHQL